MDQSTINKAIPLNCLKYVLGAKSLQKHNPVFQNDDDIKEIYPVQIEIRLKLADVSLMKTFYQCPVTFTTGEHSGKATVNVIPVNFKTSENCTEHAFYYIIVNKGTSKEHREYFFSSVDGSVAGSQSVNYEDRSGSIKGLDAYSHEDGNDADISGVSEHDEPTR